MTNNSEKSQVAQKIVNIAIFAAACKPGHKCRNRVSGHNVSASSRPTGLRLSHVDDPVAESATKCFGFALWHKEFDDFSLFVLALSSSFHDFTV